MPFWGLDTGLKTFFIPALAAVMITSLAACGGQKSWQRGGVAGTKPYTVKGKTYYPLKSAHNFVEEGVASWYGPGFHGKKTANGETYNQYAMTAAHKILPLGTQVRVTNLKNGRSILLRINDRGPFVDDRIIDLSRAAATRLEIIGAGTGRVRVQSVGTLPTADEAKIGIDQSAKNLAQNLKNAATARLNAGAGQPLANLKGNFYIQTGAFSNETNARKLIAILAKAGNKGRLIYGSNNMWNVQVGPWTTLEKAEERLEAFRTLYPRAFVVGD